MADVRELVGFVPWYFNLPNPGREVAWKQLIDSAGIPGSLRTHNGRAAQPAFQCFPIRTSACGTGRRGRLPPSQTLVALANLLNNYRQDYVGKRDYLNLLTAYSRSQRLKGPDGAVIPFIDEDLNPLTGEWDRPQ